jgi:hypothetical protein
MLIKYQNIVFKLPKFPELEYLSEEKKNEFIYVLIHNFYQSLGKKDNYIDVVDYGKLSIGKKEALLKKTYDNIFYKVNDFQSVLTSKKETQLVSNNEYIENM